MVRSGDSAVTSLVRGTRSAAACSPPPAVRESIEEKQERLAALRERVRMRKESSIRVLLQVQQEEIPSSSRGSPHRPIVIPDDSDEYDSCDRSNEEHEDDTYTVTDQSLHAPQPASDSTICSYRSSSGGSNSRRLALKEKLREKEAHLARLRYSMMEQQRKRPLPESSSPGKHDGASSHDDGEAEGRRQQQHHEHIKRLRMMAAQKRQDLERYRTRFAATATEAF